MQSSAIYIYKDTGTWRHGLIPENTPQVIQN